MNQSLTLNQSLLAIFLSGAVIFATRIIPFIIFREEKVPALITFIEKYTPSLIMAVLVVYCFKDTNFSSIQAGLPFYISVAVTVILHLTLKNTMITICSSTALFLILSRLI